MKQTITTDKIAVDTNILVYLHEATPTFKCEVSHSIVRNFPILSSQVLSEYINVLNRLLRAPKLHLIDHCLTLTEGCTVIGMDHQLIVKARELVVTYDFQVFDSIIVASALQAGCNILYSEDFQHYMIVENQLTIINPYLEFQ
ncbi:putative nucleic acid-binding protein [Dyadobacter sp. BE34]|uniref:Nucleic acid-binding protein n=1 Tax=Dyadobacter fermentans TaxID=94254 RepID=A0ABU1QRY2_9BACT|nr:MULTISPECIES: PIN domain-containing protein [Dyadobacter]MDR6803828.1 putative nucleic acid-binding protein [Dyadobacter fermentans]MDR7041568.1 putative nucleic acid-binding protein [Dyadobacter sp. BE242]MDR7195971.1 putative nucleic acid-binding protein [Dyadobacter sp. BE34]MDR7213484.1 putative nucleic acid-binding protein [Dyadobacter sp. BE31]MDR7261377.1 putative nucleic acid-binding protein [Dyadobacter sp. BE32]